MKNCNNKTLSILLACASLPTLLISQARADFVTIRRNAETNGIIELFVSKHRGNAQYTEYEQSSQLMFFDNGNASTGKMLYMMPVENASTIYITPEQAEQIKKGSDLRERTQLLKKELPQHFN